MSRLPFDTKSYDKTLVLLFTSGVNLELEYAEGQIYSEFYKLQAAI